MFHILNANSTQLRTTNLTIASASRCFFICVLSARLSLPSSASMAAFELLLLLLLAVDATSALLVLLLFTLEENELFPTGVVAPPKESLLLFSPPFSEAGKFKHKLLIVRIWG